MNYIIFVYYDHHGMRNYSFQYEDRLPEYTILFYSNMEHSFHSRAVSHEYYIHISIHNNIYNNLRFRILFIHHPEDIFSEITTIIFVNIKFVLFIRSSSTFANSYF